ncbi:MAG: lysoplasmalogenase [Ferruginibacter sp.]
MKKIVFHCLVAAFWLLVFAELISIGYTIPWLEHLAKPLLMPALCGILFYSMVKMPGRNLILTGLIFSWVGDTCLLLEPRNAIFFIAGLAGFFITHVSYILYFLSINPGEPSFLQRQPIFIVIVLFYGTGLVWFLFPFLGQMKLPVILYASAICSMLLCSIHILTKVQQPSNHLFISGAVLFVLSDSILAVNKFYEPLPFAGIWIMISYCAAQYFIVSGFIRLGNGHACE